MPDQSEDEPLLPPTSDPTLVEQKDQETTTELTNLFGDFVSYAQTIGIIEAGVTQISRRSIPITTL